MFTRKPLVRDGENKILVRVRVNTKYVDDNRCTCLDAAMNNYSSADAFLSLLSLLERLEGSTRAKIKVPIQHSRHVDLSGTVAKKAT